jgi:hypothetical protein
VSTPPPFASCRLVLVAPGLNSIAALTWAVGLGIAFFLSARLGLTLLTDPLWPANAERLVPDLAIVVMSYSQDRCSSCKPAIRMHSAKSKAFDVSHPMKDDCSYISPGALTA